MKNAAESIIYDSNLKKEFKGKIQLDLLNILTLPLGYDLNLIPLRYDFWIHSCKISLI